MTKIVLEKSCVAAVQPFSFVFKMLMELTHRSYMELLVFMMIQKMK